MHLTRPPYLLKKLYPDAIWRKDISTKKIYLTFDDGPVPAVTPWVLDILKQYNIKATFFCVGENVQKNTTIYQRILAENHSVGNHTFNHLNGWSTQSHKYIQNIEQCAELVHTNLFRPPYGRTRKSQAKHLRPHYSIIMWDVLSGDYNKKTSKEKCLQNVTDNFRNGSIIVFHDSLKAQKNLEYTLPRFIEYALKNGFEFACL